jgi:hypothetical protein
MPVSEATCVVEGRVERLKVAGNRYAGRSEVRAETPALAPGGVPNFSDVQRQRAKAQRPDRRLTPLLRHGRTAGTVEVDRVDATLLLHGSLELNDKAIPADEEEDAVHIALATLSGVEFIATWNFAHMVSPAAKYRLQKHIDFLGYACPLLATPEELLETLP